jgi:hypothetical protein
MTNWKVGGRKHFWPNFKVLSWHLPGGTEEKPQKTLVMIASLQAKI